MNDLDLAISAARAAGGVLRQAFRSDLEVSFKSPDQPVTEADHAANEVLQKALRPQRPHYGWISEESESENIDPGAPVWVIDPLDGTWTFIEGRPEFAVCIGLLDRGTPLLGVVYNPIADVLYHAARGDGAFRGKERIRTRKDPDPRPLLVASVQEIERGRLDAFQSFCEIESLGSTALKMARIAEGGADLYVSGTRKGIWDVCAATVIVTEAGGTVSSADGRRLDLGLPPKPVRGLIVRGAGEGWETSRLSELLRVDEGHPKEEE